MINNVTLVGRLTRDPEIKHLPNSNTSVVNYTLAIDNPFRKDADGNTVADFINCVTFGNQAENLVKFKRKGNLLGVTGRIQTRTWNDAEGNKKYATEVITNSVDYIVNENKNQSTTQIRNNDNDDILPF
jgi:single-strand DNA-binding protein